MSAVKEPATRAPGAQTRQPSQASDAAQAEVASFDALWWPVGTRVQLVTNDGKRDRLSSSTLVGFVPGEYLIVRTPFEQNLPIMVEVGAPMRVRAILGTNLGELDAVVERVFRAPVWYLHLSFPKEVRVQKLRAAPRVKVDLPVTIDLGDGNALTSRMIDLSAHGAQLTVDAAAVEKGATAKLKFQMSGDEPDESVDLDIAAKVMTSRAAAGAAGFSDTTSQVSLGVRFDGLDAHDRLRIANFVYRRLLSGG